MPCVLSAIIQKGGEEDGLDVKERNKQKAHHLGDRHLDSYLRRGFFFLQGRHKSLATWRGHIHTPGPFADRRRDTLIAGYYLWPRSETKAREDSASLIKRQTGKCGRERGLFWFAGCIFLNHQTTTKFSQQKHTLPEEMPSAKESRSSLSTSAQRRQHINQSDFPFP